MLDVLAKSGEAAKSGPIGLAVILLLCIVCYFLFKSMSKHMRKVREDFPGQQSTIDGPLREPPAAEPSAKEAPAVPPVERPAE